MITIDSDPILNPIFIGGIVIRFFNESDFISADITSIYNYVEKFVELSFELFLLSLDWLFIIGVVELDENGVIFYAVK
ncbi:MULTISPECIES: ABC-three component system middle component 6 [Proteus]|uniref:ABC-three component system middle component 6 n=1 Tax=Proteus TaxID=583 RepID=UPI000531F5E0|nr:MULTISPECIES: ABC-three component system middle component 6 [Proteus]EIT1739306.1 hypothetical protein [Proteus mirabilis]EJG2210946.1 hypothetical protein [Proteus mirabilis]EKX4939285.1 hypothetical protein [Proteus mirabilis]EKX6258126.1 hypothetical protein [Proteus mirabilis]EKX6489630.1 hypothetical protein [Proteus mirabilis]